jgi:hypothetical protein
MSIFIPNILKNVKIAKDEKGADSKWRDAIKKYGIDSIPNLDPYKSIRCEGEVYQELCSVENITDCKGSPNGGGCRRAP